MKNSTPAFKILSGALLCAVLLYFVVQLYRYASDPISTAIAYRAEAVDCVSLNGYLVRDEQVLSSSSSTLYHVRSEGERVGIGQAVAVAYGSASALDAVEQAQELRLQAEQLQFALESRLDRDAALRLDDAIRQELLNVRRAIVGGDLGVSAETLSSLKSSVMKRDYTYTSKEQIETQLTSLQAQIRDLEASLEGAATLTAEKSAVYSAECDGFESVLTPDTLKDMTPARLRAIQPTGAQSNVGKLIYGDDWYYTAVLSEADAQRLSRRESLRLRFAKGLSRDITMSVDRLTRTENGEYLLVARCNKYLSATTLLRHQAAEIILKEYEGLRLPSNALRVQEGMSGVYCVAGKTARFKPLEILYYGENFVLAVPTDTASGTEVLRQGDEVIVTNEQLFDGKVIL